MSAPPAYRLLIGSVRADSPPRGIEPLTRDRAVWWRTRKLTLQSSLVYKQVGDLWVTAGRQQSAYDAVTAGDTSVTASVTANVLTVRRFEQLELGRLVCP